MLNIAIIIGSTRPGRRTEAVARWVFEHAQRRTDARFELVDIASYDLPLLDEAAPPMMGQYTQPHTKAWAATIARFDGFIFVTPEYNHGAPAALKNAIDYLYREWNDKVAGFVSLGGSGGVRAVEQLRLVMGELKVADVRAQVSLSLHHDFENYAAFKPAASHDKGLATLFDQIVAWGGALATLRAK